MKYFIFLSIIILSTYCGCKRHNDLQKIKILYLPDNLHTSQIVTNPKNIGLYWNLIDSLFINENDELFILFNSLLNNEKKIQSQTKFEIRIVCLLKYKNFNKIDTLSFGEYFGTSLNSVRIFDDKKLLKLIKERIYLDERQVPSTR